MSPAKRWLIIALTAIVAMSTYYLLPETVGSGESQMVIPELARRMTCIFIVAIAFWATEVIPLFATSLLIIGMQILFLADNGGIARWGWLPTVAEIPADKHIKFSDFLSTFSQGVIILFMGGFLLSAAIEKHGLDKAIAYRLLRPFSGSPFWLLFAVLGVAGFFSMWMSNTATAVMVLAIVAPLIKALPSNDTYHRAIVLAVPFGANIGGIGTPIGTPPNAIALAQLRQAGYDVGFVEWMMLATPLALILLVVSGLILWFVYRPKNGIELPKMEKPDKKISWQGRAALFIMISAVVLWITGEWTGLHEATVALLAAVALCALGVLSKKDVDSIDWNVLILMWGGLSLGKGLELTGVFDVVKALPIASIEGAGLAIALTLISVGLGTFMSHTAATTVLVPLGLALAGSGSEAVTLGVLIALASSFAMAMPISTPPNAIAYGTGKIPALSMVRVGGLTSIICILVLIISYQVLLPWALNTERFDKRAQQVGKPAALVAVPGR